MKSSPDADLVELLKKNLAAVDARIHAACQRSGRQRDQVQVIAVTKYVADDVVQGLIAAGHRQFAENRPQRLAARQKAFPRVQWHLIGQLQKNKVRSVVPIASQIHSVDSLVLLERIGQLSGEFKKLSRVLLQVNVTGEEAKSGFDAEQLQSMWDLILKVRHVEVCGLMTMAPLDAEESVLRHAFRSLRELRDSLQLRSPRLRLKELSMGMSQDYEVAVEEGATLLRLGSCLFEGAKES